MLVLVYTQIDAAISSAFRAISAGSQVGVLYQCTRGGQRIVAAGTDSRNAVIRINDLPVPA